MNQKSEKAVTSGEAESVPVKKTEKPAESSLQRVDPWHLLRTFDDMERMFGEFFPRSLLRQQWWNWPKLSDMMVPFEKRMPNVDIIENDDNVVLRAELPGIDKKDIEVSMTDNTITIKGETRKETREEKDKYYRCEITQGSFSRTLNLPARVNMEKAQAVFRDGMLELTLPKLEQAKRRTIKVV